MNVIPRLLIDENYMTLHESYVTPFAAGISYVENPGQVLEPVVTYTAVIGGGSSTVYDAVTSEVATLRAEERRRRAAASLFARVARASAPRITEIWLEAVAPDLLVTLVLETADLERELALRGVFIDLMAAQLDPSAGELSIYTEDEGVPEWIREGESL